METRGECHVHTQMNAYVQLAGFATRPRHYRSPPQTADGNTHKDVQVRTGSRMAAPSILTTPFRLCGVEETNKSIDFCRAKLLYISTISRRPCPDAGICSRASSVSKRG